MNMFLSIIILIVGIFLSRIISSGIEKILTVNRKIDPTISGFLSTLARYTIIIFTLIIVLSHLGVKTSTVLTILGAASMAIGLALQGSITNFASGVLLVVLRPFKTNQYVDLGTAAGTIVNVHIFYTTLRTLDGKIIIVPNGKIISGNIINYSREPFRRNEFIISVGHDADVDCVIEILKLVLSLENRIVKKYGVVVGLHSFNTSSLNFIVRCWCKTKELNKVYLDLMLQFKKELDKNNIPNFYSQMEIRLNKRKEQKKKIILVE